jgi:pimeloyl-ACP methyl ester carboxylesterase
MASIGYLGINWGDERFLARRICHNVRAAGVIFSEPIRTSNCAVAWSDASLCCGVLQKKTARENELSRVIHAVATAPDLKLDQLEVDRGQQQKRRKAMPYVTVAKENSGNIDLYYEDHGSGQPVVLIHGYPLSGTSWEKQVPFLLNAGHRVIAYDRRGFGKSSQPTTGYNYDTFAEDLHQLITQLKLRNFTLVGFSMGGGEVARYIGKYGSKGVSKAVIISGVPPYLLKTADNPEGVDASVFAGIEKAVAADRYAFFTGFFQNFYNTDLLLGKRVSEQAVQASWNVAATASATASLACVATWHEDFRGDVSRIDVPTLVIHGDADRILPITAAGLRTAKLIKGARLLVVKDGPHCIPWTHAEEVNTELLSFLGDKAGKSQKDAA